METCAIINEPRLLICGHTHTNDACHVQQYCSSIKGWWCKRLNGLVTIPFVEDP